MTTETVEKILEEAFPNCHNRFMQPSIEYRTWYVVETNSGETHIMHDANTVDRDDDGNLLNTQEYFFEDGSVGPGEYNITERKAWGAQMQAPGYMDQTEWSLHDTELEAAKYLAEYYSDNDCTCEDDTINKILKDESEFKSFDGWW